MATVPNHVSRQPRHIELVIDPSAKPAKDRVQLKLQSDPASNGDYQRTLGALFARALELTLPSTTDHTVPKQFWSGFFATLVADWGLKEGLAEVLDRNGKPSAMRFDEHAKAIASFIKRDGLDQLAAKLSSLVACLDSERDTNKPLLHVGDTEIRTKRLRTFAALAQAISKIEKDPQTKIQPAPANLPVIDPNQPFVGFNPLGG